MSGKVYFIAAPGRIKIGYTRQPEKRLRALRNADMENLVVLGIVNGSRSLERLLHLRVQDQCIRGEWFSDCAAVREVITEALSGALTEPAEPSIPPKASQVCAINKSLIPACRILADDVMKALFCGENKYEIRERVRSLIVLSEAMIAPEIAGDRNGR